jgi:integrase
MAHVQRRERGGRVRWRARVAIPGGQERSRTFDRKVDAERWIVEQESARTRGEWVDPRSGRILFEDWVDQWRLDVTEDRPTTLARKMGIVETHLVPRFAGWPIAEIRSADVKAMLADDLAAGLSNATGRKHVFVLSGILEKAVSEQRLARNPCSTVKLPPERPRRMRFLDPRELAELAAAHPRHHQPLVLTAGYVGLRWGELASLALDRVDLLRRTITVDRQLIEVGGKLSFGPPKTKAGTRVVSIPASLVDMLGSHFSSAAVQKSGLAFPTTTGRAMRRSNFPRRVWKPALAALGWLGDHPLAGLVFHEMRHTAAALAIAQGAHPLTVKERLGHSSITVTMDRYGHLFPAQDEALAEALDDVLRASFADDESADDTVARIDRG